MGLEMVDITILNTWRVVDLVSGTTSRSANPDLTVQAARLVVDDASGVELNCGRSKPFSTHSGMDYPSNESKLPFTSLSLPTAAGPLHHHLRRHEDPPASDATRHARPHGVHRRQEYQLPRNLLSYAQRTPALVRHLEEAVDFVKGLERNLTLIENGDASFKV
ncbi:hypothetical protein H4582DRAFT_637735 [Lactarius indigo]|nr:hypothetical protein H4582DRAFT_637735 [Lactarius indigo]